MQPTTLYILIFSVVFFAFGTLVGFSWAMLVHTRDIQDKVHRINNRTLSILTIVRGDENPREAS